MYFFIIYFVLLCIFVFVFDVGMYVCVCVEQYCWRWWAICDHRRCDTETDAKGVGAADPSAAELGEDGGGSRAPLRMDVPKHDGE
jgi:hypothetical protein